METFLKKGEVQLINGGYLSNGEGDPVTNADFVACQERAHYIVTFAKHAKGKDFEGKEAHSLAEVKKAVAKELAKSATEYVAKPEKVKKKLTDELADEALAFMKYEEKSTKADKINAFLQDFNALKDFEDHGLFFTNGIVKLNKLYYVEDIVKAVTKTIDLLD